MSEAEKDKVSELETASPIPPLRILSIATLFPDATRPNFGIFVERSLGALARQPAST